MYYPEDVIEEVRNKSDIVDIISSYIGLKKRGGSYVGLCPFHNEKTPSFHVSDHKQLYHCFGCGASGNVFTFIMEYENYSFIEAINYLGEMAGVKLTTQNLSSDDRAEFNIRSLLYEINKEAATFFFYRLREDKGEYAYKYLIERGIDRKNLNLFGLGFANQTGDSLYRHLKALGYTDDILKKTGLINYNKKNECTDKFWNRIVFPIQDTSNKIIGFGGRVMGDGMPKYLNSPETLIFDKSKVLYGINYARKSRKDYIIICEGYLDVIALHQAGFTNAVASLGTAFTSRQAFLLKRYSKKAYLVYDSDEAGIKASINAIHILEEMDIECKVIDITPYKDPDDFIKNLGKEEFNKRIEKAKVGFFFETDNLLSKHNMEEANEKSSFFYSLAKMLLRFRDKLERDIYIEAIAKRYNVGVSEFEKIVNKYAYDLDVKDNRKIEKEKKFDKKTTEDPVEKSQKILLTWLVERKDLYHDIKDIISSDDFTKGIYKEVADYVFSQLRDGINVQPAKLLNNFQELEKQSLIGSMFSADLQVQMNDNEFEKALNDIIKKIKANSLDEKSKEASRENDLNLLQNILLQIEELDKINIKLSKS